MSTPIAPAVAPSRPRRRLAALFAVLGIGVVAAVLVSAMVGQVPISPTEMIGSILRAAGIPTEWAPRDPLTEATLWQVRFPRIVMGIGVGAALAVSGAVMQAIFGNPLAEPGVVGVSSGAALGAAFAIVVGVSALGGWGTALFAFCGGLVATLLVYLVSRANGRTEVVTLLLTGIAVNAFGGAGIAFLLFAADQASREQIVFWQLGSLNGSLWPQAGIVVGVALVGTIASWWFGRRYDLLSLGERTARNLGVNVEVLRIVSIVLVALLTGVAVAFCGIIAFVGLVVPHIIRMAAGPRHRPLIAASALGGGILVVLADLFARTLIGGADLPIGMLTSLIGGPFFFFLLFRQRRASGGWG
jgi:iron complex transport system permease protein